MTVATTKDEGTIAALTEAYGRIGQLADDVLTRVRQGEALEDRLDDLDRLVRETVPLYQSLQRPAGQEALSQLGRALTDVLQRVRAATEEAASSLRNLGEQLDEGIRGQKGNRAYLTNNP